MVDKVISNNVVTIVGIVKEKPTYSHEMFGEDFYSVNLIVPRLSDVSDELPVTISERLIIGMNIEQGIQIIVEGQLRSYNKFIDGNNKLILTIFARSISLSDEEIKNPNQIFLDGYICKKPIYRTTPFGREITDMLIAVNRPYNKSDYIPSIAWGRNARYSEKLQVGDRIRVWGRIQSREYQKKIAEEEVVTRTAYEVSISKMEIVDKNTSEIKYSDSDTNCDEIDE
ncbi:MULTISPECIES: single-stranded DNA-binding protein [Lutispora]|uniref:Single-stranded DNA-binding protein n=1 Tax=Lutispora saccharofermentans TaxID=3024236 RepID=A0ABT1NIP8_9FIRM|nr:MULTISPECIES: single-stranded DNA-binding protein [Lutispora]MCQ1531056.1 single-stranded DNA-binding protein [Lutispora saccharofermentans]MEA4961315.1 single-stranded DNA-binding protein [Lutispora sp.]